MDNNRDVTNRYDTQHRNESDKGIFIIALNVNFFTRLLNKLYVDPNEVLWGLSDSVITSCDGTDWTIYTSENSGLISNDAYSIVSDHNNTKKIGTNRGVSRFDGEIWTTFTTSNSGLCNKRLMPLRWRKTTPSGSAPIAVFHDTPGKL
ncbi:MAG: hypothetical protein JXB48_10815 [Candidatus Latescibacteria bacterium]|nr:hypothetical protein [Candidatus Latescibacterota bacterium]